jgi:biotin carboxylase
MRLIAIIGVPRTDYTLIESIIQARLLGLEVVLVDLASNLKRCPAQLPVAKKIAVDFLSPGGITTALRPLAPQIILSFTEFNLILAAQVRERLNLVGSSVEVEKLICNKEKTRRRLCECGLSEVDYKVTSLERLKKDIRCFEPPLIIKPIDLTGSIGVYALQAESDIGGFQAIFDDLKKEEKRQRKFIIERYIHGDEYSIEGICINGKFHMLTLTRKRTSGFPHFFEVGHTLPAREHGIGVDYNNYIQNAVEALGIETAPIHAEIKISGTKIEMVEIHTRFGGDYIPLLMERAFGYKVFGMFYSAFMEAISGT